MSSSFNFLLQLFISPTGLLTFFFIHYSIDYMFFQEKKLKQKLESGWICDDLIAMLSSVSVAAASVKGTVA